MAAVFNLKENSTGDLEITVSGEEWSNAVDKAFKKLANKISIPGFRKGKVPAQMLEKYVSENERMMQAVEDNMNAWLIAGMQEANVEPISRPSVDIKSMDAMGVTLVYTFEVMPEVKLGNYVGLDYAVKETVVTDEEFDILREYVKYEVKELCERMVGGDISIIPCKNKNGTSCDFCSYASICQFDVSIKGNTYTVLNDKSDEEVIKLMEKEVKK